MILSSNSILLGLMLKRGPSISSLRCSLLVPSEGKFTPFLISLSLFCLKSIAESDLYVPKFVSFCLLRLMEDGLVWLNFVLISLLADDLAKLSGVHKIKKLKLSSSTEMQIQEEVSASRHTSHKDLGAPNTHRPCLFALPRPSGDPQRPQV